MEDFNSKYTGTQVEALLDIVAQGGSSGGGGGTITEAEIAAMGFTKNLGTITEIKMNGVSKGASGVVDLGEVPTKEQFDNLVDTTNSINEDVAALYDDKQDTITDLQTIREGAEKGATSVQSSDIENVARKDSGYVIANGILDESDDYWHLPKNSLNDKEHTLASKSDIEEKILVIGDSSDEAKANFIAVANGEKTADIYIGSVDVQGDIIEGCVKLAMSGSSSNPMYSFTMIGNPTSGRYIDKLIKVTCRFANGAISSEVNVIDAYSKPSTGIPKTDLASDVQTTLDNAATFVVAAFDLSAIYSGDDIVYPGKDVLMNAIREGKTVRIPFIKDSLENGYVIAQAYCEDLLYMTIENGQDIINIDTSISDPMLYASDITIHTIANRAAIEKAGELEVVVAKGVDDRAFVYATPTSANGDEDDVLLSRNTVKTINGESIFGSGDITIEGGGESNNVWVDAGTATRCTLTPNTTTHLTVGNTSSDSIVINEELPSNGDTATLILYIPDSIPKSISLPSSAWANNNNPVFESGKAYEISFMRTPHKLFSTYTTYSIGMGGTDPA